MAQQAHQAQQAPQTTVYEDVLAQAQGMGPPPTPPPGMGGPPQGPPPGMGQGVGGAMPPGMAPPGMPGAPISVGVPLRDRPVADLWVPRWLRPTVRTR